jgi:hypothetical protein
MNSVGIKAEQRVIQGRPDFFNITKKMHNALQGADINLFEIKTAIFEEVNFENAVRNRIDHDIVLVHDPQPLDLIDHLAGTLGAFAPRGIFAIASDITGKKQTSGSGAHIRPRPAVR